MDPELKGIKLISAPQTLFVEPKGYTVFGATTNADIGE